MFLNVVLGIRVYDITSLCIVGLIFNDEKHLSIILAQYCIQQLSEASLKYSTKAIKFFSNFLYYL